MKTLNKFYFLLNIYVNYIHLKIPFNIRINYQTCIHFSPLYIRTDKSNHDDLKN